MVTLALESPPGVTIVASRDIAAQAQLSLTRA
jgi:hypothetical protein